MLERCLLQRRRMISYGKILVVTAAVCAACGIPRDPEGTLARVRGGVVRVGVVHNPPWAALDASGEAAGVEPGLVRELAAELGARVEWVPGGESELLAALEHRGLDLVIGGLSAVSPWSPKLGLSRPYYADTLAVAGVPAGRSLRGVRVGVEPGRAGAAELEARGAVPVPVADLGAFAGPVAAPVWRLERLGLGAAGEVLAQEQRVFAVPPGENGWLTRVERFLHARRSSIPAMPRRESR